MIANGSKTSEFKRNANFINHDLRESIHNHGETTRDFDTWKKLGIFEYCNMCHKCCTTPRLLLLLSKTDAISLL